MPQVISYSFDSFAEVYQLQANGINDSGDNLPSGIPTCIDVVADPLGQRGNVMRATTRDADAATSLGQRSEIRYESQGLGEYWFRWKFMLPESWADDRLFSIMQIHDSPDGGDNPRFPNFLIMAGVSEIVVMVPNATLPTESATGKVVGSVALVRWKWYDCCLHVNWQTGATGFRVLFIDQVPVIRQFGIPTHYADVTGPYFKLGVYDYNHAPGWGERTAYFDDVEIWSGNDGYQAVMGLPEPAKTMLLP